ncbi:MAG: hypothetical protein GX230_05390 [Lentisphaerae bacterium]|jgi:hypothetical protein|nr:hypothetical protein [Lentisphaerota bacterium]
MRRRNTRVFRYGRESGEVLLENGAQRSWRLATRDEGSGRSGLALSSRGRRGLRRGEDIGHYMFAGGMRQHASAHAEDIKARQRRLAIIIMLGFAAAWLVLRWLPL